ncbi:MAG: peptide MFS transporter [Pseudomonadota bacterium]
MNVSAAPASERQGLFLLSGVEMWERFSYHMMRAMLVLFLTAPVAAQGFGWASADAYKLYGFYTGLIYVTPVVGGWLADRRLGLQPALILGASLMCLGHFLMAGPAIAPWLADTASNGGVSIVLETAGVPFAQISRGEIQPALAEAALAHAGNAAAAEELLGLVSLTYQAITFSFYAALGSLIIGAGFFLPSASSLLGKIYGSDGPQRERGFFIFYLSINIGATLAPIAAGIFGERLGWHFGFTVAGFAMAVGLSVFLIFRRRMIGDVGRYPPARPAKVERVESQAVETSAVVKDRLVVLLILAAFTFLSDLCLGQIGGLLNVLTRDRVDRVILGYEWPTVWFQTFYPFFIVVFLALLVWLTRLLDRVGRNPPVSLKFSIGFGFLSLGLLVIITAMKVDGMINPLYIVVMYALMAAGEVLIYPVARAMVTRYAPQDRTVTFMGVLFLMGAFGSIASGYVAALSVRVGEVTVFTGLVAATSLAVVFLAAFSPWFARMSHGLESVRPRG